MKTWSIRKPCFHALLARRSMRANRKPSVKVVNLSCRFSNSLVTGIDQQPCESPEHKSPSFLQEEVKKIWFIMEENHLRCVQESCVRNTLFYPLLASFGLFSFHTSGGVLLSLIISGESRRWTNRVCQHEEKASTSEGSVLLMFFVSNKVREVHDKLG